MKGLIQASGIAAAFVSATAMAELTPLEDAQMSAVQGQAGLTVELAAQIDIGEIAYHDAGFATIKDLHLGGQGGTMLDNVLMTLDVAGNNEVLHRGFSKFAMWADQGLVSAANADVADAIAKYSLGGGQYGEAFGDGDLVIHIDSVDSGVAAGNSSDQNIENYQNAIDFQLTIDSINLHESSYAVGSQTRGGLMFSNIDLKGNIGPVDIIIRNGTGATNVVSNGTMEVSDAMMEVDAYFRVTEGDLDWDNADVLLIFNLAAVKQRQVQINNTRGLDATGAFGFADVKAKVAEGKSLSSGTSGLALWDVEIRADVDMPVFQFGDAPSIGGVYFTDFVFQTDVVVYGH